MLTPAQQLVGLALDGDWTVTRRLELRHLTTGGHFSESYIVQDPNGREAFLKALDFSGALKADDPVLALKALADSFIFERNLLERCSTRRLDRVVTAITGGTVRLSEAPDGVVQYLIFELADSDLRVFAMQSASFDLAWIMRSLHHVATGIRQLHSNDIAHQDLKPSNVLIFDSSVSKVADLGRAASKGEVPPHDGLNVPGDYAYAPPELLYGYIDPDWNRRRLGCDIYLLGSLVVFCLAGVGVTQLVQSELRPEHQWREWKGTYSDVLPYIREAFERLTAEVGRQIPEQVRGDILSILRELCDPDPHVRGDRQGLGNVATQYRLDRYVTRFDLLARRAEISLRKSTSSGNLNE